MQGGELPTVVYLVTVDGEWPVSATVPDRGEDIVAEDVALIVERRKRSENVSRNSQVHVWRARLVDLEEVDLMPTATVRPSIRRRQTDAGG